jgi:hypothetical protein
MCKGKERKGKLMKPGKETIEAQGQLLAFNAIITSLISSNPGLKINEKQIGELIFEISAKSEVRDPDVEIKARAVMNSILSQRNPD